MESDYKHLIFRWSAIIHLVGFFIFTAALALLGFFDLLEFNPLPILIFVMPATFAANALWLLMGKKSSASHQVFYLFCALNLIAVTAILHLSGGQDSPFLFLYLISVISATLISIPATLSIGISALFLFLLVVFLEPPVGIQLLVLVRILRLVLLGTIITFQGYYFTSRIKKYQQEVVQLKDQFLFHTIHSLRSPATALKWTFERFSEPDFIQHNPDIKNELEMLRNSNERIIMLTNDILAIAKGERLDIDLRKNPVILSTVIKNVISNFKGIASKKRVSLYYKATKNLPAVWGDSERIQEVIENLIDNGIKYNRPNGSITIRHEVADEMLKTFIQDTGEGIAREKIPKLFSPYFRARKDAVGTGLGLYITREFVEKMNGAIEVSSALGKGTTFVVSLPIVHKK